MKTCQPGFEVINNLPCQYIWIGKVIKVGKAFIFEPEDVEVGFAAGYNLFLGEARNDNESRLDGQVIFAHVE